MGSRAGLEGVWKEEISCHIHKLELIVQKISFSNVPPPLMISKYFASLLNLATFMCRLSENPMSLKSWSPWGLSRSVQG